ncbi:hypothetical protein CF327_g7145 [Tilletia walkeri]|nr:hypothetical protein CF327_g7145 [Tilletia walkeri]
MAVWKSMNARDYVTPAAYTGCSACGLPLDFCREQARHFLSAQGGGPSFVRSSSGKAVTPCRQDRGDGKGNPTIFILLYVLTQFADIFEQALARVKEVHPTLDIPAPGKDFYPPGAWLQESPIRVQGKKTFLGFWLVLAFIGVL